MTQVVVPTRWDRQAEPVQEAHERVELDLVQGDEDRAQETSLVLDDPPTDPRGRGLGRATWGSGTEYLYGALGRYFGSYSRKSPAH